MVELLSTASDECKMYSVKVLYNLTRDNATIVKLVTEAGANAPLLKIYEEIDTLKHITHELGYNKVLAELETLITETGSSKRRKVSQSK